MPRTIAPPMTLEHEIGGSIDTTLRWVNGWNFAQIDSGCGTGALNLGIAELRDLAAVATRIADRLEAAATHAR